MNMASKIYKELNKEIDLKTIKKILAVQEKLKNDDDDELVSYDEMEAFMDDLLGKNTVGDAIRIYRHREEMTQNELALRSGIKRQHISEIERGERNIGVATAKKLAAALNCNYRSLL
ncbi:MAG: helix-turn-helix transcriptional regulator [Bacteriovoracaceae bacterium]